VLFAGFCLFEGSHRNGDFVTVEIQYYRKMNIAGRRYARGPSVQKLSRSARKEAMHKEVDASGADGDFSYIDIDIDNCFPQLLYNRIAEARGGELDIDYPVYYAFVRHYKQWRAILSEYLGQPISNAKKMLIAIFFLARPQVELGFLWRLAVEMQQLVEELLKMPENAHLLGTFGHRRNPDATRLFYAMASLEDSILSDIRDTLQQANCGEIITYMFDGAIVKVPAGKMNDAVAAVTEVGDRWRVSFKVEKM